MCLLLRELPLHERQLAVLALNDALVVPLHISVRRQFALQELLSPTNPSRCAQSPVRAPSFPRPLVSKDSLQADSFIMTASSAVLSYARGTVHRPTEPRSVSSSPSGSTGPSHCWAHGPRGPHGPPEWLPRRSDQTAQTYTHGHASNNV